MSIEFENMLLATGMILRHTSDKKERKKKLLSLAKRCTPGARAFIQRDLLESTNIQKTFDDATTRYLIMAQATTKFVKDGASGAIIYKNEVYPVYINPDCRDARSWAISHEEYVIAMVAIEFAKKYNIPKNEKGIVSLFVTSCFSGLERVVVFNEAKPTFIAR